MLRNIAVLLVSAFILPVWAAPTTIQINPKSPVVITADFTMSNGVFIKAPWYQFDAMISNTSGQYITVMEIQVDSIAPNGQKTTTLLSSSDFNYNLKCLNGTVAPISFISFGTIAPGATTPLALIYSGPALPADCNGINPNLSNPIFYVGGNLPIEEHSNQYIYQAHAIFMGWYGTLTSPTSRFQQEVDFVTQ